MTYEELVEKTREVYSMADASGIEGHVAYQFNITGEAEGAFYLEISDGQIHIEPYEYYDRDVLFVTTAENLIKIGLGELDPVWAFTTGKLKVEGNIDKALLLKGLSASIREKIAEEKAKHEAAEEAGKDAVEVKEKEPESQDAAEKTEEPNEEGTETAEKAEELTGEENEEGTESQKAAPVAGGQPKNEMRNRGKKRSNRKKKRR